MDEIIAIRRQLGLSQQGFAEKMGVSQAAVSRWESGDTPVNNRTLLAARALLAAHELEQREAAARRAEVDPSVAESRSVA